MNDFRIGIGYDVHRLEANRKLILGGVQIPYNLGLLGHSDADVLVHAICDALLGAVALGDIGRHFPDTDDRYQNIDSLFLLKEVKQKLTDLGYVVSNIDSIIVAQKPHLASYLPVMEQNIAAVLNLEQNRVSVKATTTEKLGFAGREEGIAAQAVACVCK